MKLYRLGLAWMILALQCAGAAALGEEGVLTLPAGLKVIGEEAFYGCAAIRKIIVPEGAEIIGPGAFAACDALTELTLPASITYIDDDFNGSFDGCARLTTVHAPEGSYAYTWAVARGYIQPEASFTVLPMPEDGDLIQRSGVTVWQHVSGKYEALLTFAVDADQDWSYSAPTIDNWWAAYYGEGEVVVDAPTLSPEDHTVWISLPANLTGSDREAEITFTCGSETRSFIVRQLPYLTVELVSPSELASKGRLDYDADHQTFPTGKYADLTLEWKQVPGAVRYEVCYDGLDTELYVNATGSGNVKAVIKKEWLIVDTDVPHKLYISAIDAYGHDYGWDHEVGQAQSGYDPVYYFYIAK